MKIILLRTFSSGTPFPFFRKGTKAHLSKEKRQLQLAGSGLKPYHSETANEVLAEKDVKHDNTYQNFDSRKDACKKLEELINQKDDNQVIGVYGIRGVGKTLLTEQACKQALENKIFDKFMIVHVGKEVNVMNIQDQLGVYFNLSFNSKDDEQHRASQVKKSMNEAAKNTLVLLDNVWDAIPLERIGIPLADDGSPSKVYKILLTSLTHDVCSRNNCKDPTEIKELTPEEAQKLFMDTVGISEEVNSLQEDSLEDKVCKRCIGLPLLIRAVGRALKGVSDKKLWKAALNQIEDGRFGWIDGIEPQVYACLKLSFDRLAGESKTFLFSCALFPENALIDIEMLSLFSSGSPRFKSEEKTLEDIDRLKSYFMVQNKDEKSIQVTNIIRDVARSLAARDPNYAFSYIRCKSWLPENVDYSTRKLIYLDLHGDDVGFPNDLVCRDLRSLWLNSNNHKQRLSGGLFTNLTCLLIKGMVFTQNQWPADIMKELKTLILDGCKLQITFLCFITNHLETLRIRDCDFPDSKDDDIRQLDVFGNLITVEISRCTGSKFLFPAAVAKSVTKMRELRIEGCHVLEELVKVDGSTDQEIRFFPELKSLILKDLPNFTQLEMVRILFPQLQSTTFSGLPNLGEDGISFSNVPISKGDEEGQQRKFSDRDN